MSEENTYVGMRLVALGSEVQGRVRAVYEEDDGRGEYVIISGDKVFLGDADSNEL